MYRPPYSDDHRVPIGVFLPEFPEYVETVLLCKELLLITGDFNIHVDDLQVSDTEVLGDTGSLWIGATRRPTYTPGWAHARCNHHAHVRGSGHQYTCG